MYLHYSLTLLLILILQTRSSYSTTTNTGSEAGVDHTSRDSSSAHASANNTDGNKRGDADTSAPVSITVLVLNQHHKLHVWRARQLQRALERDAVHFKHLALTVYVGSLSFPDQPYWTFFPLLEEFSGSTSDWFLVIDEFVHVNLGKLLALVTDKTPVGGSPGDGVFLGRGVWDKEATATHHYAAPRALPSYPDTRPGFLLSGPLLRRAAVAWLEAAEQPGAADAQVFHIDAAYEFSAWLRETLDVSLDNHSGFCVRGEHPPRERGGADTREQGISDTTDKHRDDDTIHKHRSDDITDEHKDGITAKYEDVITDKNTGADNTNQHGGATNNGKIGDDLDEYLQQQKECVTVADTLDICQSPGAVPPASVGLHVAVKTYSGNHDERLPVLRRTWLPRHPDGPSHALYSDVADPKHGTVITGVENTERGHCAKTLAILRLALEQPHEEWRWLLLADDDTIVSLPRLSSLLSCYASSEAVAIGEVYGYRSGRQTVLHYPTGGSGIVMSRPLVTAIVSSPWCRCASAADPDDMLLGLCLQRLGRPLLHSRDMHQNTPQSYAEGVLRGSRPISFHKHWMIDPVKEYYRWLHEPMDQEKYETVTDKKPEAMFDKKYKIVIDKKSVVVNDKKHEIVSDEKHEIVSDKKHESAIDKKHKMIIDENYEMVVDKKQFDKQSGTGVDENSEKSQMTEGENLSNRNLVSSKLKNEEPLEFDLPVNPHTVYHDDL